MPVRFAIALLILLPVACVAVSFKLPTEPALPVMPKVVHQPLDTHHVFSSHQQILPQAWVLHVQGNYNVQQAKQLVSRLQKAGLSAYLRMTGKRSSIYVGPSVSQVRLQKLKQELQKRFNLIASVEDYQVTWPRSPQ